MRDEAARPRWSGALPDAVKALPNMGGSGKVRELRQAA